MQLKRICEELTEHGERTELNVFCVTHKKTDFPTLPHLKLIQENEIFIKG